MQSKKMSIIETCLSTLIGLAVAITTQIIVFPWFGMQVELHQNFMIAGIFTVISIARGYVVRRVFNWLHIRKPKYCKCGEKV